MISLFTGLADGGDAYETEMRLFLNEADIRTGYGKPTKSDIRNHFAEPSTGGHIEDDKSSGVKKKKKQRSPCERGSFQITYILIFFKGGLNVLS